MRNLSLFLVVCTRRKFLELMEFLVERLGIKIKELKKIVVLIKVLGLAFIGKQVIEVSL